LYDCCIEFTNGEVVMKIEYAVVAIVVSFLLGTQVAREERDSGLSLPEKINIWTEWNDAVLSGDHNHMKEAERELEKLTRGEIYAISQHANGFYQQAKQEERVRHQ